MRSQHPILMQWDAEKVGVQYGWQRVKITGVNGARNVICQTAEVNLWLLGKK